jgi:hypothetical protein
MNCGIMRQNEPVSLQERKQFIQKPVRTSLYKPFQVVDIIKVENLRAATNTESVLNNVASCILQRQDTIECAFGHIEAVQDVV